MKTKFKKLIALMIGAAMMLSLAACSSKTDDTDNTDSTDTEETETTDSSSVAALAVTDDEKQEMLDKLQVALDNTDGSPLLLNLQDGEESYVTCVYNSNGESLTQRSSDQYITIYMNDYNAVQFGEYISYGKDADTFDILKSAINMAESGEANYMKSTEEYQADGVTSHIIDICGFDEIAKMYSYVDEDFGETAVEQLKSMRDSAAESDDYDISTDDEVNFRFIIITTDEYNWIESFACYVYFGDIESLDVTYDDLQLNWVVEGVTSVYDWEMLDGWYSTDWSTLPDWDDDQVSEATVLLNDQFDIVSAMLEQYTTDNGYDIDEDEETSEDDLTSEAEEIIEDTETSSSDETDAEAESEVAAVN